ncbi:MAG: hypothetical protein ACM37W_16220 [Actinomycetota bacterium]
MRKLTHNGYEIVISSPAGSRKKYGYTIFFEGEKIAQNLNCAPSEKSAIEAAKAEIGGGK